MTNTGETKNTLLASSDSLTIPDGVQITPGGLKITEDLPIEEWVDLMRALKRIGNTYKACVGDGLHYGKAHYGEEAAAAQIEQLEFSFVEVDHGLAISTIPLHMRNEYSSLQPDHFRLVATMCKENAEKERWLNDAVENDLSKEQLKESINAGKVIKTKTEDMGRNSGNIATIEFVKFSFMQWKQQVGDTVSTWDDETKKEFLDQTRDIVKMHQEVAESLNA